MKQQVPLVGCSRCIMRWPLGGVVDAVHPVSGEVLPDHPMLLVLADRKVACYECVLKNGFHGTPLTAELFEAIQKRPAKNVAPAAVRVVSAPNLARTNVVSVVERRVPITPANVVRVVLSPVDVVALMPEQTPWHAKESPPIKVRSLVSDATLAQIQADLNRAAAEREALQRKVREDARRRAIEKADSARLIDVGGKPVPVVAGRMARAFPRPALGAYWPLPEGKPLEIVPMGTAIPAYVPREDVIAHVLDASEVMAVEFRVKGLPVTDAIPGKKRSAQR